MHKRIIVYLGTLGVSIVIPNLYSFINIDKVNVIIAHTGLLQVWAYEHIAVVWLVGLQQMRNDMINVDLVFWMIPLGWI